MRILSEAELSRRLSGIADTPRVVIAGNFATPRRALTVVDQALVEYRLFALNTHAALPDREGVTLETPFVGPSMRGRARLRYFPCRLSLVPGMFAHQLPPDIVVLHTSPVVGDTVSLGIEVNILPAAIEAVRARGGLVIAQLNPGMPYVHGDAIVPVDDIDYAIEVDEPLPHPTPRPSSAASQRIGDHVAALIPDGSALQLGIGAVPDAVLAQLTDRRNLVVWSEMFSDGVLAIEKAGALDPDAPVTASFVFGGAELYDWIDHNPRVQLLRTEKTNDLAAIARHPALISVNTALQIDLFGQANAHWLRGTIYSGFGGQVDFVGGSLRSPGGRAIIALPSWHPKADVSTVVPRLPGPVTSFQHTCLVSEQGTAEILGNDMTDQAQQILDRVAHPHARDHLREHGRKLGLPLQ
ncbi:hypothetical protein NDR87_33840 [Nocardia sp. CDC159]|uniref:Acyl-CoA hydrolase n=1 Tax=Nocardia pulmonis TaxID=2951408 RepID=A0A9X2J1V4_9NOCA|nr:MULTISPECIES: acetyl-CoA hydrolase/transferase C-terminal domain-containing protein [Nocardia]MCM6778480.1 hypothetical protein [Nocardia pulmonis]MCM6791369.1 hypothetical protein [Nocardia sp. CDC159]